MAENNTVVLGNIDSGGKAIELEVKDLVRVARNPSVRVEIAAGAPERVTACEEKVKQIVAKAEETAKTYEQRVTLATAEDKTPTDGDDDDDRPREYGITTGFGEFKDRIIPFKRLDALQRNLILSHAVGVGENTTRKDMANYYSAEVVRAALLIRLNTFLKGHSGVRLTLVHILQAMLNCGVIPLVPLRGSVGASGDLCPLSHLFATLLGEGSFYRVRNAADLQNPSPTVIDARKPTTGRDRRDANDSTDLLDVLREEIPDLTWETMDLRPKEGLALNNGAAFSAAMLALGVHDADILANTCDVAVAMTLEAIGGCTRAFDEKIQIVRPHPGQAKTAARVRSLLEKGKFVETARAVQDAYSVRCAPQVHGASHDAIGYVATVARNEINAATDNPLFFDGEPWDAQFKDEKSKPRGLQRESYSGGNFHGQPIALAADFLTIAVAELANISERRTQMLLDSNHNRNLPGNLIPVAGLNSGFMIAQYTAASLVSENKVLSHPASVDSIPTSANSEDHVSMATHAARKMRSVIGNAQSVVAIELLAACQALEWRAVVAIPARYPPTPDQKKNTLWFPTNLDELDSQAAEFVTGVKDRAKLSESLAEGLRPTYLTIREQAQVSTMIEDRRLDEDIRKIRELIAAGRLT